MSCLKRSNYFTFAANILLDKYLKSWEEHLNFVRPEK
jgi:hypothetical protein